MIEIQEIKNRIREAVKRAAKEKNISQDKLLSQNFKGGSGLFFNNVGEANQDIKLSFLLKVCEITGLPCSYFLEVNNKPPEETELKQLYEVLALKQKIIDLQASIITGAPNAPQPKELKTNE